MVLNLGPFSNGPQLKDPNVPDENGWNEYRIFIREELGRLSAVVEQLSLKIDGQSSRLTDRIIKQESAIATLKGRVAVYGTIGGISGGVVAAWALGALG